MDVGSPLKLTNSIPLISMTSASSIPSMDSTPAMTRSSELLNKHDSNAPESIDIMSMSNGIASEPLAKHLPTPPTPTLNVDDSIDIESLLAPLSARPNPPLDGDRSLSASVSSAAAPTIQPLKWVSSDGKPPPIIERASLVIHGKVNGRFARILIDSGCDTLMIRDGWVRKHRFERYHSPAPIEVAWGDDGDTFNANAMFCGDVTLWGNQNQYQRNGLPFIIAPLRVDIILGLPFILSLMNFSIFRLDGVPAIKFSEKGIEYTMSARRTSERTAAFSCNTAHVRGFHGANASPRMKTRQSAEFQLDDVISWRKLNRFIKKKVLHEPKLVYVRHVLTAMKTITANASAASTSERGGGERIPEASERVFSAPGNPYPIPTELTDEDYVQVNASQVKSMMDKAYLQNATVKETEEDVLANVDKDNPLRPLLEEYRHTLFAESKDMPPDRGDDNFRIELETNAKPVFHALRQMSEDELKELHKKVTEMLAKGWIRHSSSPWGAAILFAKKKDGGLRLCIDYRGLNSQTKKDRTPLPNLAEMRDAVAGKARLSTVDVKDAYHRLRVRAEDIEKTAFRTRFGHFEYTVMPFGLTNAPAAFQRVMNKVLGPMYNQFVICYLDDVLIFSDTIEEHKEHVRKTLDALLEHKLFVKPSKCQWAQEEVEYCGHLIGKNGWRVAPSKIEAVNDFKVFQSHTHIQQFLGLTNYMSVFVDKYADIALPLTKLQSGKTPWKWGPDEINAVAKLKEAITNSPCLAPFDRTKDTYVFTDASGYAIGGWVGQPAKEGDKIPSPLPTTIKGLKELPRLRPITFFARKMKDAETRYIVTEQELLAIVKCLKANRHYLMGLEHPFRLLSDHHALIFLQKQPHLSRRQAAWVESLQEYDFTIEHIPGEFNTIADVLSRNVYYAPRCIECNKRVELANICAKASAVNVGKTRAHHALALVANVEIRRSARPKKPSARALGSNDPPESESQPKRKVRKAKRSVHTDKETRERELCREDPISESLTPSEAFPDAHTPAGMPTDVEGWVQHLNSDDFYLKTKSELMSKDTVAQSAALRRFALRNDGILTYHGRTYVPEALRGAVMNENHDALATGGHSGVKATIGKLLEQYYWPHLEKDVFSYIRGCPSCQRHKTSQKHPFGLLRSLPIPDSRWHTIGMDMASMPETKSWYGKEHNECLDAAFIFVDYLSSRTFIVPCNKSISAEELSHLYLSSVWKHTGSPRVIIGDRDPRYLSDFWDNFTSLIGSKLELSTARHQQTDGKVERTIKTIKSVLKAYVDYAGTNWVDRLPQLEFNYNRTPNHTGFSPFYVDLGRDPLTPNEWVLKDNVSPQNVDEHAIAKLASDFKAIELIVQQRLRDQQDIQQKYYDRKRRTIAFKIGDKVGLKRDGIHLPALGQLPDKLKQTWLGPFTIKAIGTHSDTYELDLPHHMRGLHPEFHVNILKPWNSAKHKLRPSATDTEGLDPVLVNGEQEWIVEKILSAGFRHRKPSYLVKWLGFGNEHTSWEPEENLIDTEALNTWISEHGRPQATHTSRANKRVKRTT